MKGPATRDLTPTEPTDLRRRRGLVDALLRPGAAPPAGHAGPAAAVPPLPAALAALPPAAAAFAALPAARLRQGGEAVVSACALLDVPPLDEAGRQQLQIPAAAAAPFIAATQARTLEWLPEAQRARFPWQPGWLRGELGKYRELLGAAAPAGTLLAGLGAGRAAILAARGTAQQLIDDFVQRRLGELAPSDPEHAALWNRKQALDELKARAASRADKADGKKAALRHQAAASLDDAQGEHRLAAIWQQLRDGQVPDRTALLEAARFFRRWQEAQGEREDDTRSEVRGRPR